MGFIAGLIGLLLLVIIIALFLFAAIFMARKIGLLKTPEIIDGADEGENTHSGKHYVKRYVSDLKVISDSLVFRFILIAVLIGFMMIPLGLVSDVVRERSNLYRGVLNEISSTWGQQQNLQGPALFVPYTEKFITEEVKTDKDGYERKVNKTIYKQRTAIVLPDDLNIRVNLNGETRKRSLYESLVYTADLNVTGDFQRPDISSLSNNIDEIHWSRSWLALGISDTQAINKVSGLNWNSQKPIDFEPGTKVVNTIASGFHAPLDLTQLGSNENGAKIKYPFQLTLNVNGSQGFYFTPFGKTTEVEIVSDWPHPSFQGSVLPNKHEVNSDGFEATWSVPNLARNYPQLWTLEKQKFNVNEFQAGVNLFESVSLYSQITRAIKYGLLFFTLTYITFLIFEMGIGRRLHIVQYGVIGLALSMFYLTLLSMAEHAGFFNAYISAAGIIILMISLYAYAAIRSFKRTIIVSILLAGLYTLLYSLLKLEDYALLAGTVLLLVILAVLMVLTRNIGREVDKGSDNNPDNGEKNNIINSGDNRGGDSKKSNDVISTSSTNIVAT